MVDDRRLNGTGVSSESVGASRRDGEWLKEKKSAVPTQVYVLRKWLVLCRAGTRSDCLTVGHTFHCIAVGCCKTFQSAWHLLHVA